MRIKIIIPLLVLCAAVSCGNRKAALVNGDAIFESDIAERMKGLNEEMIKQYGEENVKQKILEGLIEQKLIYLDLKAAGYDARPEVSAKWAPVERKLKIQYFLNEFLPDREPVPGSELKDLYNKKKELFKKEGRVRARHILVRTGKGVHTDAEAKAITAKALKEIKDGASFSDTAKKYSECPSAKDGGDLDFFTRGQMVPPFEKAAFSLEKGEYTKEPVKTRFGYHLIFIEDREEDTYTPLDEVKKYLVNELQIKKLRSDFPFKVQAEKINMSQPGAVIGEIPETGLKYTNAMFKSDMKELAGDRDITQYLKKGPSGTQALNEMLTARVFEYKIKSLNMKDDKDYIRFAENMKMEYLGGDYIRGQVLKEITVSDKEVRDACAGAAVMAQAVKQYGERFTKDAAFRRKVTAEVIMPQVRQKLLNEKSRAVYDSYMAGLKKKYPVEVKIKYDIEKEKDEKAG